MSQSPRCIQTDDARHRILLAFFFAVGCGVIWRIGRYTLQLPVWGDEGFLAVQFFDRSYLDFCRPLANGQVAPIAFLWSVRAVTNLFGYSELAIRCVPVVCGILALLLLYPLTWRTVGPLPAAIAAALLAASKFPGRYTTEFKPYSMDLLASVLVLGAGFWVMQKPGQFRRWGILSAIILLAFAMSYPVAFIVGGVIGALAIPAVQSRSARVWIGWWLAGLITIGAFAAVYFFLGRGQFNATHTLMMQYWRNAFPPSGPFAFLKWLTLIHAGTLMAYPTGGSNGGSIITTLLVIAGIIQLLRGRRWTLLAMLLLPFALNLVAAALRRYPYGLEPRIAQHLAAPTCLLAGIGLAALLEKLPAGSRLKTALLVALAALLGALAIGFLARDILHPQVYRDDQVIRRVARDAIARAPGGRLFVLAEPAEIPQALQWYLRQGPHVIFSRSLPTTLPPIFDVLAIHPEDVPHPPGYVLASEKEWRLLMWNPGDTYVRRMRFIETQ